MNYKSKQLYKKMPTGTVRQWRSWSEGSSVLTEYGQVGGKMQTSVDTVKGKSIGKVSETTAEQQAALEAEYLYKKQVKQGYVVGLAKAKATTNSLPAFLPMLAHVYEDVKGLVFPAYAQPKLDGVRCLAVVHFGKCTLYTRSQKIIDTVPHVNAAVEKLSRDRKVENFTLDGELYNEDLHDDFGRILGAIKRKEVGDDAHLVHYHVYDFPCSQNPFSLRVSVLDSMLRGCELPLVRVETTMVKSEQELYDFAKRCVSKNYEGAMYRSTSGFYEGKRSKHLLKVKTMKDGEFEVIGAQEGRGKLMGKVGAWICKMGSGVEFKAKMEGELDDLPEFGSKEMRKFIGKMITVRFQGLTPDGAPRFPVGVRFKDEVEA